MADSLELLGAAATAGSRVAVVGIGASAGGLEALQALLGHLRPGSGSGFLVVTHQRPDHPSILGQLLGRACPLPVEPAAEGAIMVADRVYVGPPGRLLELVGNALRVRDAEPGPASGGAIDVLFRSLAASAGDRAVGIVLSGMGADGTLGALAIKEQGGLTIAQDPDTAAHDSMPASAIAAGAIDLVLPPERMADRLLDHVRLLARREREASAAGADERHALARILEIVRERRGHDFSGYKEGTLLRQIQRRANLHGFATMTGYAESLPANPAEVGLLFQEMLIGFTRFFRDPGAFLALEDRVLPDHLESRTAGGPLRAWIPGCSTGEEAYSLSIVLHECMERSARSFELQIFATDVDERAIRRARGGVYPEGIAADVPVERLGKYFVREGSSYRIRDAVRRSIVFSVHDLASDPPFSRMDVVSCRNVLIYFGTALQRRVLRCLHWALRPGGVLFLGSCESTSASDLPFEPIDPRWKIFAKREVPDELRRSLLASDTLLRVRRVGTALATGGSRAAAIRQVLEGERLPAVVLDEQGAILYVHGRLGEFLELSPGRPSASAIAMARPGLTGALAGAIWQASRQTGPVVRKGVRLASDGNPRGVDLSVRQLLEPEPLRGLLVATFERVPPAAPEPEGERALLREQSLEVELVRTRESHQQTIQELRAENEELRAVNEEASARNDQLRSTLDEVRRTAQAQEGELVRARRTFERSDVAAIWLDAALRVRDFTPAVRRVVSLGAADVGRPLSDLPSDPPYERIEDDLRTALSTASPRELEAVASDGRPYLVRMCPSIAAGGEVEGVALTFVDLSGIRRSP